MSENLLAEDYVYTRWQRYRLMLATCLVGVMLAVGAGRTFLAPIDPAGCVSILTSHWKWGIIIASVPVGFAGALIACWLGGRINEDSGVFAVALGFAIAAALHENSAYLWHIFGQAINEQRRMLAGNMLIESLGWAVVVLVGFGASRWMFHQKKTPRSDLTKPSSEARRGLLTVLFMVVIGTSLLQVLATGTELAPIETGQVYFACAASMYITSLLAYWLTGARSSLWAISGVIGCAVVGYAWTMWHPEPTYPGRVIAHLSHLPSTPFGRSLPIQFIMTGTAAAIYGNWHHLSMMHYAAHEASDSPRNE